MLNFTRNKIRNIRSVTEIVNSISEEELNLIIKKFNIVLKEKTTSFVSKSLSVHNYLFHRRREETENKKNSLFYCWNGVFLESLLFRLLLENGQIRVEKSGLFFDTSVETFNIFDEIHKFSYTKMLKGNNLSEFDEEDLKYIFESSNSPLHFRRELCKDLRDKVLPLFGNFPIYDIKVNCDSLYGVLDFLTPESIIEVKVATPSHKFLTQLLLYYCLIKKCHPSLKVEKLILLNLKEGYYTEYEVKSFDFERFWSWMRDEEWEEKVSWWEKAKKILFCWRRR